MEAAPSLTRRVSLGKILPWQPETSTLPGRLLQVVDIGLAAVLFLAPLFMGGRSPLGRLVFISIVCAITAAWVARMSLTARCRWRLSGAELLLAAGVLLLVMQLTPLPSAWLGHLSPASAQLLPLWSAQTDPAVRLGSWSQVSLTPQATRSALCMYLAYAMLFLVVIQRLKDLDDIERLLRWLALGAVAMATLGLVQFFGGNGKFLWFYEHPSRTTRGAVKGTFSNENHFAQFLALGITPLVWWTHSVFRKRGGKPSFHPRGALAIRDSGEFGKLGLSVALGVVCFAALMTLSTGGAVVLVVASVSCVALLAKSSLLSEKSLCALTAAALLAGAALAIYGYEPLAKQLSRLRVGSVDELNDNLGRAEIWAANRKAISQFGILGAGIGSHREVYPIHFSAPSEVEYTHAESGYLQVLLEGGAAALLLLLLGIGMCGRWCVKAFYRSESQRLTACVVAVSSGLVASALHSIWDFVWYIPACMSLAVILAACACRLSRLAATSARAESRWLVLPRPAVAAAAIAVVGLGTAMIGNEIRPALAAPHWDRYLKLSLSARGMDPLSTDYSERVDLMTFHLEQALRRNPGDARANLRMAALQLRRFDFLQRSAENPMSLSQIRDAALASQFSSREAQDRWLSVAVGENRKHLDLALSHCRRAIRECPLQGEGYVYLAELAFLESPAISTKTAYVDQALRVRPHSGEVLLAAGGEAALAGDVPKALWFWKRAFHQGPQCRSRLIELLASQAEASFFLTRFEPDLDGMRMLYRHYQQARREADAQVIGRRLAGMLERDAAAETGQSAANLWREAAWIRRALAERSRAVECAKRVVESAPQDFSAHRLLATWLLQDEQYDQAIEQLQWCLGRKPNDQSLAKELAAAHRGRLTRKSPSAASANAEPERTRL